MKTSIMVTVAVIVLVVFLVLIGFIMYIDYSNQEVKLRNQILAKQEDNKNEYDNMWKKISQIAQVTEKDRESLKNIFVEYADARTSDSNNQVMTWVKESVPNVNSNTYQNLQNIITSSRDSWTFRQKELRGLKLAHDNLLDVWPGKWFLSGKQKIDIIIVTSSKTQNAFETGTDDNTNVFDNVESKNK